MKHGLYAQSIVPVSSQADPGQEEEWIQRWARTVQPQNDIEWNLVRQGAQLSLEIERGKRTEKELLEAWRDARFREITRRLLYVVAAEEVKVLRMSPWTDDPGRFVSQLEVSAEGCRWLLERWEEYRNLLDVQTMWKVPEIVRFIRLQGKEMVESTYDPELNAIFLAWDVLDPECAKTLWGNYQRDKPLTDPAFNDRLRWREVADRPADADAARAVLSGIVNQHVDRLQVLLAANVAREAAGDTDWAPRAGLDCSAAFERLRRAQSARHRELMKTIDELRKMGKEGFGSEAEEPEAVANDQSPVASEEGVASGESRVASGELRVASEYGVASGQWSVASEEVVASGDGVASEEVVASGDGVASGELRVASGDGVASGELRVASGYGEGSETAPELGAGSFVGQDSDLVLDELTVDTFGIVSHEETHAAGQIGQGLTGDVVTPEKGGNKANLELEQCAKPQAQGSGEAVAKAREQSQSSGVAAIDDGPGAQGVGGGVNPEAVICNPNSSGVPVHAEVRAPQTAARPAPSVMMAVLAARNPVLAAFRGRSSP